MVATRQKIMKIALFLKQDLEETDIATYIISKLSEYGYDVDQENPDVVFFVGGDGTLLRAVQTYIDDLERIKFLGINEGSLGFYTGYTIDELDRILIDLNNGDYFGARHRLLQASFDEKTIYAVNEIRIENPFHTLISKVSINHEFLENFRGNGLVVSTSNGSSAYNKSLGGAIVYPTIETMQLTEIAPINNRVYRSLNSSLVIPMEYVVTFECNGHEVVVGYDHLTYSRKIDSIEITASDFEIEIIYPEDHSFIKQYREAFLND